MQKLITLVIVAFLASQIMAEGITAIPQNKNEATYPSKNMIKRAKVDNVRQSGRPTTRKHNNSPTILN